MAVKKYKWLVEPGSDKKETGPGARADNGAQALGRLDQYLAETLPRICGQPVSKAKVRKLIVVGGVYLNSRRVKIASKEVFLGARVEVYVDWDKLSSPHEKVGSGFAPPLSFSLGEESVLYEDEDLLVLDKPPGLPTQPTLDDSRQNLFRLAQEFMGRRVGSGPKVTSNFGAPYLGLHHRLDRDTSGVLLLTKSRRANPGIAESFLKHEIQKEYLALVSGGSRAIGEAMLAKLRPLPHCEESLRNGQECLQNHLGPLKQVDGKRKKFGAVRSGGDFAHTDIKVLKNWQMIGDSASKIQIGLVSAFPRTGRTHQIRVHLSELGYSLLGDPFYGGLKQVGSVVIPRVMLHAASLTFPHPIHQNRISVRSSYPEDFAECIEKINKMGQELTLE